VRQNESKPHWPAQWIRPDWPAPARVKAFITTRHAGASLGPYSSFNLALHCGDDSAKVLQNRATLRQFLPQEPFWLHQIHGTDVVSADQPASLEQAQADACIAQLPHHVCPIMVADCLPILLACESGQRVAAVHAGWRGLAAGIIEKTVLTLSLQGSAPERLMAYIGPGIGASAFEVGEEVYDTFLRQNPHNRSAFIRSPLQRWHADLHALALVALKSAGVHKVYGQPVCTYSDPERFYSYRRDRITGRMAAFIWLDS